MITLAELRALVEAAIQAGQLRLPITAAASTLGSFNASIVESFPSAGADVVVDAVTLDATAVTIVGTTAFGTLDGCALSIALTPTDDGVAAVTTCTLPPSWTLPALLSQEFAPAASILAFSGGHAVVRSSVAIPGERWTPGLAIDSVLDSAGSGAPLPMLLEAPTAVQFAFSDPRLPAFTMTSAPQPLVILGMTLADVSIVLDVFTVTPGAAQPVSTAALTLEASFTLGAIVGALTADLAPTSGLANLRFDFGGATLARLGDLATFVGAADLGDAIPSGLWSAFGPVLDDVGLRTVALSVDLGTGGRTPSILTAGVTVAVDLGGFPPFPAISDLSIDEIDLVWTIDRTTAPPQTTFSAIAVTTLAPGCTARVTFRSDPVNGYTVTVTQDPGTSLQLSSIAQAYLPGLDLPQVALQDFGVRLQPTLHRYALQASFVESWDIPESPELSLDRVQVAVSYDASASSGDMATQPRVTGSLLGVLSLDVPSSPSVLAPGTDPSPLPLDSGRVIFTLEARRAASPPGWILSGAMRPGQQLSLPGLARAVAEAFDLSVATPPALEPLVAHGISLRIDTASKTYGFSCGVGYTIDGHALDLVIELTVTPTEATFHGTLLAGPLLLDVIVDSAEGTTLIATARAAPGHPASVNLHTVVADLSPAAAALVPVDLEVKLEDLKLVLVPTEAAPTELVLGLDLSIATSLDHLPVVGGLLPAETLALQDLQVLVSSGALTAEQVTTINGLLPSGVVPLPAAGLSAGVAASATVVAGAFTKPISLGIPSPPAASPPPVPAAPKARFAPPSLEEQLAELVRVTEGDRTLRGEVLDVSTQAATGPGAAPASDGTGSTKWFDVQRSAGPFTLARVGLAYQGSTLFVLLDASASLGGLELGFTGLGLGSPLSTWAPVGHLSGVSVAFSEGDLSLAGALLVNPTPPANVTEEYAGTVTIGLGPIQVSGVAAFARIGDDASSHPSFFAFAEVDASIGGPPAFFITGLMGGFGYEWALRLPAPEAVATFPLIAGLSDPSIFGSGKPTPDVVLAKLTDGDTPWVAPETGQHWIAGGLAFRSFELIAGRLLAVVAFGKDEEIALLGTASVTLPQSAAPQDAYAFVELQLEIALRPRDGVFSAIASLTPTSFLLTKDCHLTGGFALCFWFDGSPHEGDFVLTIGGYHPAFDPPAWYPAVPAVGINWQVGSTVVIKGTAYFALTPTAIMAGGSLELLFQLGGLKAWFIAVTNLLVRWKPFAFQAQIGVSVGVSYRMELGFTTVTVGAELSAMLELWGTPTGGVAHVHWWIISFSIPFGADPGAGVDPTLDWDGFKALLPSSAPPQPALDAPMGPAQPAGSDAPALAVVGLSAARGLASTADDGTWTVRADAFQLRATSAAPLSALAFGADLPLPDTAGPIDVRPMGVGGVSSVYSLAITPVGEQPAPDLTAWDHDLATAGLPSSLWGAPLPAGTTPPPTADVIDGCVTGLTVTPPPATAGAATQMIDVAVFVEPSGSDNQPLDPARQADPIGPPVADAGSVGLIANAVASTASLAVQRAMLDALAAAGAAPPTQEPLTTLAADAGRLFDDAPLCAAPQGEA